MSATSIIKKSFSLPPRGVVVVLQQHHQEEELAGLESRFIIMMCIVRAAVYCYIAYNLCPKLFFIKSRLLFDNAGCLLK